MFRFKLEPVLGHRRLLEDDAKRDFQVAMAALNEARERREAAVRLIDEQSERIRSQQGAIDWRMRELHENFIRGQELVIDDLDRVIEKRSEVVEERRAVLIEASKRVKILEKLREKELKEYEKEELRQERILFDEIAVREFNEQKRWEKDARRQQAEKERIA